MALNSVWLVTDSLRRSVSASTRSSHVNHGIRFWSFHLVKSLERTRAWLHRRGLSRSLGLRGLRHIAILHSRSLQSTRGVVLVRTMCFHGTHWLLVSTNRHRTLLAFRESCFSQMAYRSQPLRHSLASRHLLFLHSFFYHICVHVCWVVARSINTRL